jgi:hypothetical protein
MKIQINPRPRPIKPTLRSELVCFSCDIFRFLLDIFGALSPIGAERRRSFGVEDTWRWARARAVVVASTSRVPIVHSRRATTIEPGLARRVSAAEPPLIDNSMNPALPRIAKGTPGLPAA